jgi:general secretion pathway protein A
LEQVRLLTNLETSKEKLLQIVLLGQPELRDLLQRRNLRQLAQRITARYHLSPLSSKDTHRYIRHRMQVAGSLRNPFRRSAMNALYQRSRGIPRLINIIADRSLTAAYAKEQLEVKAAMVHEAANEVQLGERQIRRARWPWLMAAAGMLAAVALTLVYFNDDRFSTDGKPMQLEETESTVSIQEQAPQPVVSQPAVAVVEVESAIPDVLMTLDPGWLNEHQREVWRGLAQVWHDSDSAVAIQAACDGDSRLGYACLRDQGSWSKIRRLNLPVVLVLQGESQSLLLIRGMDDDRLLVGPSGDSLTVSKDQVDSRWLGAYFVAWPQAPDWPVEVGRGDTGPAVTTIMEMAALVDKPYHGGQVFDTGFDNWLRDFQARNGLKADGIIGRKTLLYLMTASIDEPVLLQTWND